ncbi:MAG: hypothetical protein GC186_16340 [Rhodobacteraceae bacterium]|nr:hypothetical protein [Paracoccaceae bacterium]
MPSGQPVTLQEVVWPDPAAPGQKIARFRFVAPKLRKGGGNEADMMALCEAVARPAIAAQTAQVDQIVVSLAQMPLKLGERRPDVVQVFEAYEIDDGHCALAGL